MSARPPAAVDVFLYVTHLLGSGHLRRSAAIANELCRSGRTVCLVSGGMPLKNLGLSAAVTFVQLPPVRARDGDFSDLVDAAGNPIDAEWWAARSARLMDSWQSHPARVVMVESYPFARRQMRTELIPFLERAGDRARLVCSIRDILQPKTKPARIDETVQLVNRFFLQVMVHGDRNVAQLRETFAAVDQLRVPVVYTGYIDDAMPVVGELELPRTDVVVAAGGGAVGAKLYQTAIAAASQSPATRWLVLVGHTIDETRFQQLLDSAPDNLSVQRNRPDYRQLLKNAVCSVSQAGYNTAVDILQTGCKAVFVPYSAGVEREQSIRADKLAALRVGVVLSEAQLSVDRLLAAIDAARRLPARTTAIDLDGAATVSRLLGQWLDD